MTEGVAADAVWRQRLESGSADPLAFAEFVLTRVSRTFALNIRVLPRPLRDQVLYAYLYCRMADTLEDDAVLPAPEKSRLLTAFAALFESADTQAFHDFPNLLPESWKGTEDWEKILLERAPVVLRAYPTFPAPARAAIARCVTEMCGGMAEFALRQESKKEARLATSGDATESGLPASEEPLIRSVAELDQYCYYVAGTVGVMLCELFVAHARIGAERAAAMRALCVSFGLGLQLTNILKDLRDDSDRGVVWLPADLLAAEGLTPATWYLPENRAAAGRVYNLLFAKARAHLEEALEYTCLIPRRQRRLRLFCLWPLLMAAETLALLASRPDELTAGVRLKIPRARVARILMRTNLLYFSNTWIRAEFRAAIGYL